MVDIPKSCTTCQHRVGMGEYARCTATGWYASTIRKYPNSGCDRNFSGWVKRLGLFVRIMFWLKG